MSKEKKNSLIKRTKMKKKKGGMKNEMLKLVALSLGFSQDSIIKISQLIKLPFTFFLSFFFGKEEFAIKI